MDKETREFLQSIQGGMNELKTEIGGIKGEIRGIKSELQDFRSETNTRFDNVEERLDKLEAGQEKLEAGQEEIKAILGELEPLNANRHLEIKNTIEDLKKNLSTVEIVTASNYADIAKLKSVK